MAGLLGTLQSAVSGDNRMARVTARAHTRLGELGPALCLHPNLLMLPGPGLPTRTAVFEMSDAGMSGQGNDGKEWEMLPGTQ